LSIYSKSSNIRLFCAVFKYLEGHQISKNKYVGRQQKKLEPLLNGIPLFDQVMVMELLSQWGISGFMDHVAKVEEFYRGRRDRMQQAAEKHLTG
jgi:DNA-binding transcriptional MocR family regulator